MSDSATTGGPGIPQAANAGTDTGGFRFRIAAQPVWRVGVLASLAGAAVTEVFALGARGLGVPMAAASPGAAQAVQIPPFGFALAVLYNCVLGVVLAVALARWARRPARIFLITALLLTALSLIPPALAPHTAVSTQVVLAVSHLVAAAVVIPPLTLRLGHAEGRRTAG